MGSDHQVRPAGLLLVELCFGIKRVSRRNAIAVNVTPELAISPESIFEITGYMPNAMPSDRHIHAINTSRKRLRSRPVSAFE